MSYAVTLYEAMHVFVESLYMVSRNERGSDGRIVLFRPIRVLAERPFEPFFMFFCTHVTTVARFPVFTVGVLYIAVLWIYTPFSIKALFRLSGRNSYLNLQVC